MDEHGYHYPDVPQICADLQAEGVALRVHTVYARRGRKGSHTSISADIKHYRRQHGLVEEDREEDTAVSLSALSANLPTPDPEQVERWTALYRARANMIIAADHLKALLAALRCVDQALPQIVPFLNAAHARRETQSGLSGMDRSNPPFAVPLAQVRRVDLVGAYSTLLQSVTSAIEEGKHHGDGRPAA